MRPIILLAITLANAAAAEPLVAPTDDGQVLGLSRALVTLLGVGVALMLLAVLFLIRRFIGTIMNVVFLLLGAALVIVALFGQQIGIYDAIDQILEAGQTGPGS